MELAIENLGQKNTVYSTACAVLLAQLMEEFGEDVTDTDVEQCMRILQSLKPDLKNE